MNALAISEDELLSGVVDLAKTLHFRVYHALPARTTKGWRTPTMGDIGWPDLTICGHGRVIYMELKSERAMPTEAQTRWLDELLRAGNEVYLVYPSDWLSGHVARVLQGDSARGHFACSWVLS